MTMLFAFAKLPHHQQADNLGIYLVFDTPRRKRTGILLSTNQLAEAGFLQPK